MAEETNEGVAYLMSLKQSARTPVSTAASPTKEIVPPRYRARKSSSFVGRGFFQRSGKAAQSTLQMGGQCGSPGGRLRCPDLGYLHRCQRAWLLCGGSSHLPGGNHSSPEAGSQRHAGRDQRNGAGELPISGDGDRMYRNL